MRERHARNITLGNISSGWQSDQLDTIRELFGVVEIFRRQRDLNRGADSRRPRRLNTPAIFNRDLPLSLPVAMTLAQRAVIRLMIVRLGGFPWKANVATRGIGSNRGGSEAIRGSRESLLGEEKGALLAPFPPKPIREANSRSH